MGDRYVAAVGAYLPLLRLDRDAAASALRWSGLGGSRKGRRALGGWDEDALTLAVEAARITGAQADQVIFASTSAYFTERAQASLMVEALALPGTTIAFDIANSRRCGVSALLQALRARGRTLVAAGERRPTKPGSAAQLNFGDGGAAVVADDSGVVRFLGSASLSRDFVDIYTSRDHPTPYPAEERFVREAAAREILIPAINAACQNANVRPSAIRLAAVAEPVGGTYKIVAASLGITAANSAEEVVAQAGDLGAALPLFTFALALDEAKPGDIVLLVGFGSGCDALLFEVTGETPGAASGRVALGHGVTTADMLRFLSLTGSLDLDWGPRSELDQKAVASVLSRHGRDMLGFIGGRDSRGNVQFPRSVIPVDPAAAGPEPLTDVRLADETATVVAITADRLNYSLDPPFVFGIAQFANGARVPMEYTDIGSDLPQVGDRLAMRFRIKALDRKRGFRTYFWKAAPVARPALEA